jgi:uncharacterized membrane protein YsdA (DUF1294 family)
MLSAMTFAQALLAAALLMNLVAFGLFGWDKRAAGNQRRRVPEARLLWCCLLGGFVGGWMAMSLFRHKTRKRSFQWRMIGISALWLAGGGFVAWQRLG